MEDLIAKLKVEIIEALNLEKLEADGVDTEASLFNEGLGLDSIDALELIVLMEKEYGIKIEDPKKGKEIFYSIRSMADFITKNQ